MGNSRADFIALKEGVATKVQCKTAATRKYKAKDTTYTLGVLTTTRNGESKPYCPTEVDEFFVIGDTLAWAIPNAKVHPRKTIMLEANIEGYAPRHGFDTNSWRVAL